ncbi:DMT family transporter [Psychromarinibacter halotolerans]|uniref:DMT family transporter n=1 Tax=Psychromarinibacter halotolerans TaxID=1775175 RepID=A0ABV7GWS0_9RHOB|nr:DMT family transporter [Psychromarinibacter halotolerans]MDF0595031.1 DMT family transporter [Psychromarinibacter halotolerans]
MTQKSLSPRAWAELACLALIWGGIFLSVRIALDELGVATVVAHRVVWAALILWGIVLLRGLPVPKDARTWGAFLVMGLLNNALPYALMAWGQLHIESGLTSILNAATALFGVAVAAIAFRDERLTARRLTGVTVGFAGVVLAIGPEALLRFDLRSLGQVAVLGGAFSYALAGAWGRRMLSHLPPLTAAAGMLTGAAALALPAALWLDGLPTGLAAPATLAALAYAAVIGTAVAYLLYFRVLKMAGSGNLLLTTLLIPPVAILLGAWVLDETLPPRALAGFAILALGLAILDGRMWRMARRPHPPRP